MPSTQNKQREESIHHFSHKHELFFYSSKSYGTCVVCNSGISTNEEYLTCERCKSFSMHKSCAELPRELKHPFHQQHSLTLLDEPPRRRRDEYYCYCCACGVELETGFVYECSECEFYIHSKCAMLFPTTRLPAKHQKLRHPHPLIVCQRKIVDRLIFAFQYCGGCSQSFDDFRKWEIDYSTLIYVCLECHVLLHESCADLPQHLTHHPLHPDCTLTFRSINFADCDFCQSQSRLYFQCSDCSIKMDIRCALLTPCTATNYKSVGEQKDYGHPHPLIHCNIHVNYGLRNCGGCYQRLEESAYYCTSCKLWLDESCAHLPHQIQHAFHPHHPLSLSDSTDRFRGKWFRCNSCDYASERFAYLCHPCKFYLDLRCISPPLYPMIYMPELHQHPLAYRTPYIRCTQCDFEIHTHRFPLLPPTVKALWHRHPLTLTRRGSPSIFDPETFYCDVCEDAQSPDDPSYNCAECDLASHVHCVMSEVMKYWQEKSTSVKELLGDTKLLVFDEPTAIDSISVADMNDEDFNSFLLSGVRKEIETVKVELEEHEEECAKLSAKLEEKEEKCKEVSCKLRELEEKLDLLITKRRAPLRLKRWLRDRQKLK